LDLILKLKIRPFRLLLLILAAMIAIAFVAVVFYYGLRKKVEKALLTEIALPAGQDYKIDGNSIAYLTDNALYTYEIGKKDRLNEQQLATTLSGFDVRGNNKAAYAGSSLQIWGQSVLQLNGEIAGVRCGKTHVAVLRRSSTGDSDSIVVFDANGNNIADTPGHSEGKVIDFGFYVSDTTGSEHELLWVIVVSLRTSMPIYTVTMWEYANGARGTERYLPQFHEQAIEKLYFTDESIFAVGTQDIIRYPISGGKEKYRIGIYGQKVVDLMRTSSNVYFLLLPRVDVERKTVRILSLSETDEGAEGRVAVHLKEAYISIFFSNGVLQSYGAEHLQTVNVNGKKLLELELPQAPLRVYKLDGGANVLFETALACYLASIG
jgi:hypothetical protein